MENKNTLVRVKTDRLDNETFLRFMFNNRQLYAKYGVIALNIDMFMNEYDEDIQALDDALERIRKSPETARIAALDKELDNAFSGIRDYVKMGLRHFEPNFKHSAENLYVVFHQYGDVRTQPYRKELASCYNLLQDLNARSADVAIIKLEPWMSELKTKADALSNLIDQRVEEDSHQSNIKTLDARKKMETTYQTVTNRLDAMINIKGRDFVPGFVDEYNRQATEYKNKLAQHLGRVRKNKDEE